MKLRCTPNSIRLRVRKSDLDMLQSQGEILVPLNFPGGVQLHYALKTGQVKQPQAEYMDHQITITLPLESTKTWIESEQVGIEYYQDFAEGQSLHLLIEKDFPCRHTEEQELKDTFFELAPKDDPAC